MTPHGLLALDCIVLLRGSRAFLEYLMPYKKVKELQSHIEGTVTSATDAGYEQLRRDMNWNQLTPMRY